MNPFQTQNEKPRHAVTYTRVSSTKQLDEGDGLASQRRRCEDYARREGYTVVKAFEDRGVSGGLIERPAMQAMLTWLLTQTEPHAVIIDDISRFSRDVTVHWQLRDLLAKAGGKLVSPSITFGDTSDDKLVENLLASVSQHQREKIGETSVNRMKARVSNGYWVFRKIPGYKYVQTKGEGKVLVRDEPVASIVVEALEGFASGRFGTQAEVQRYLEAQPDFPKQKSYGGIRMQKVTDMLTHPLYAGFVQAQKWDIPMRKGRHDPLISVATYEKIQKRITGTSHAPKRKNLGEKFALRGFVTCGDCDKPLRSCESKSGTGKLYAYYLCHTKKCPSYGKSIPRDKLEGDFAKLLKTMHPSEGLIGIVKAMFADAWQQRAAQVEAAKATLARDITKLERQIDGLLDKLADTTSQHAIRAYERKLESLEREKLMMEEKRAQTGLSNTQRSQKIELALAFLSSPWKLWTSGIMDYRRLVLKLAFTDRLPYTRNKGYRTPKTTLPFKVLTGKSMPECKMVPGGR
ncbi:MAG: recombinase family protein, partial [Alphaproteobacteria bacterium]